MKYIYNEILIVFILLLLFIAVPVTASFATDTLNISLNSDKISYTNVSDALNDLYQLEGSSGGSSCPGGSICYQRSLTLNSTKKCRRAEYLHFEKCACNNTMGCAVNGGEFTVGSIIPYGNSSYTEGDLTAGDAFTCDVNGDGFYDETKERFYYISDLYTGGTSYDSNYAVLVYYSNVIVEDGVLKQDTTTNLPYHSYGSNNLGPVGLLDNLPTTTQWSNVSLVNNGIRQIYNSDGGTTTHKGDIVSFSYTNKAARLLTYQEIAFSFGEDFDHSTVGLFDDQQYRFLFENTWYSDKNKRPYWLETPYPANNVGIYSINPENRNLRVYYNGASSTNIGGVRPVIEVLKTDIAY